MPDIDVSDVDEFAQHLNAAAALVMPRVAPVVKRGALSVKKAMQADASGHRRLGGLPGAVEYTVEQTATAIEVEVGFRKEGQGNLANIAAFGTSQTAPVMDITRGLRAEAPTLIDWLGRVGVEVIR